MTPNFGHGKICYVVIPATEVAVSAAFYEAVFGWSIRRRENGEIAFDDGVGQVSGTWATGLRPQSEGGLSVHMMVDDAVATLQAIEAHSGAVVRAIGADAPEITAWFRDPGGNVMGIYQHRG